MKTYSMDLRERVVAAVDRKQGTWSEVAARFGVSRAWVGKLLRQRRTTGSIGPRPRHTGSPPALDASAVERLRAAVEAKPDATLDELRSAARLPCGRSTVDRALRRLGYARKKSRSGLPSRTGPRSPRPAGRGGRGRVAGAGWSSSTSPGCGRT